LLGRAYTPAQRHAIPNRANKIIWSQLPRGTRHVVYRSIGFPHPLSHLCRLDEPFKPLTSQIKCRGFSRSLGRGCRPEPGVLTFHRVGPIQNEAKSFGFRLALWTLSLTFCRSWCAGFVFFLGPTTKLNRLHYGRLGLRTCESAASRGNMCHDTSDGHVGCAFILLE
jgi:hypothetical protein